MLRKRHLEPRRWGLELIDLRARTENPDVQDLLFALVGWRDSAALNGEALARATAEYQEDANLHLYGTLTQGRLTGLVGLETASPAELVIRHIVVHPAYRASGLGRAMIRAVNKTWRPPRLAAETDATTVGFYCRCGFSVHSPGEKYPGTERFWCVLEPKNLGRFLVPPGV